MEWFLAAGYWSFCDMTAMQSRYGEGHITGNTLCIRSLPISPFCVWEGYELDLLIHREKTAIDVQDEDGHGGAVAFAHGQDGTAVARRERPRTVRFLALFQHL